LFTMFSISTPQQPRATARSLQVALLQSSVENPPAVPAREDSRVFAQKQEHGVGALLASAGIRFPQRPVVAEVKESVSSGVKRVEDKADRGNRLFQNFAIARVGFKHVDQQISDLLAFANQKSFAEEKTSPAVSRESPTASARNDERATIKDMVHLAKTGPATSDVIHDEARTAAKNMLTSILESGKEVGTRTGAVGVVVVRF